jgi:uncharacterized membrane protein YGL010W
VTVVKQVIYFETERVIGLLKCHIIILEHGIETRLKTGITDSILKHSVGVGLESTITKNEYERLHTGGAGL